MFRFQFILTALASMALSFALRTSLWRPRFRRSLYSSIREETAATTAIHHHNNNEDQNIFLVEFRGIHPVFRCDEFRDAYHQVLLQSDSAAETTAAEKAAGLVFTTFIPDLLVPSIPAVAFVHLPIGEGEETAQAIARRCSLVRSVVKVWGQGITAEDTATQTVNNFPTMIAPIFSPLNNRSDNSWKVSFRRYGRGGKSGLDPQGKWSLLQSFAPVLLQLHGDVSMKEAKHELLFLEDWSSFRVWDDERIAREKAIPPLVAPVLTVTQTSSISSNSTSTTSSASSSSASSDRYSGYIPLKSIFGRVICEGPNIMTDFDLKKRPFIGTTTMDAVVSHLAANAALISPGDLVLDPFCGTGSLLLAAASLGATVVGSDIDGDCLGYPNPRTMTISVPFPSASPSTGLTSLSDDTITTTTTTTTPTITTVSPSPVAFVKKNNAFQRFGVFNYSQDNKTTADNFVFYHMEDRLLSLIAADAAQWCNLEDKALERFGSGCFDAIVTDPPYSRRERAQGQGPAQGQGLVQSQSVKGRRDISRGDDSDVGRGDGVGSVVPVMPPTRQPSISSSLYSSFSDQSGFMGDPMAATVTLLQLTQQRLKPGGRLVFWLPTTASVSENDVRELLAELLQRSCSNEEGGLRSDRQVGVGLRHPSLVFQRATPEELNGSLWRWLCVFVKTNDAVGGGPSQEEEQRRQQQRRQ